MPTTESERKALRTVAESGEYISTSRRRIWELLRSGQLTAVRDGGVVKIRTDELDRYIESLPAYEPSVSA